MKDYARNHPLSLFSFDAQGKLPHPETHDAMRLHRLLLAREYLGARDRGKAGSEHVYTNSAGEVTSAEQSK